EVGHRVEGGAVRAEVARRGGLQVDDDDVPARGGAAVARQVLAARAAERAGAPVAVGVHGGDARQGGGQQDGEDVAVQPERRDAPGRRRAQRQGDEGREDQRGPDAQRDPRQQPPQRERQPGGGPEDHGQAEDVGGGDVVGDGVGQRAAGGAQQRPGQRG